MVGWIVLEGGAEFGGRMAEVDRRALQLAGGSHAPVRIVPAAAAPDNNHRRAGQNGVRWFQGLGAADVVALPLVDRASAEDPAIAAALAGARLIFLLGGFPRHLGETLAGSACWASVLRAYAAGAVVAGSSAGAMVLCDHYYDPERQELCAGLGLVPGCCVLPHHATFGRTWAGRLAPLLPGATLVGIDEQTGLIDEALEGPGRAWRVYGRGAVTLYEAGAARAAAAGEVVALR
ncbi:MAG: type 1 glutamine amidotransferase-like domain-containing protein [Chloroflexales bacterium]|nr:type 1 glutamine amidotransferase-like domain-containing protein [Chloroflexales bacterium]